MADDAFQDLLELEDEFYKQGYEAGIADSAYAGLIEGKVFGIEKGYEKALELAKLHGMAMVWNARLLDIEHPTDEKKQGSDQISTSTAGFSVQPLHLMQNHFDRLPSNTRLPKHIESLTSITNGATLVSDNSDEAVAEFDERLAKARAKAKIIANIAGEPLNPAASMNSGIEDATGLSARQ